MAKKKNWFYRIKRFFGSDTKSKQEKKEKRKRWVLGRFKSKCLPALPALSLRRSRSMSKVEHEQSKHAVEVAVATAVAAEAAVAAAQTTAQVVRLAGTPLSYQRSQEVAAIRVQAAFRGYLPQRNIWRKWDCSTLSKDEMITFLKNRREAAIKRERAMEYASSYQDRRRPSTPIHEKLNPDIEDRRWSWLEEWVGAQPLDRDHHMKERPEESQLKFMARRSFNRSRKTSFEDDDSFSCSPTFPSYMASTACAKARFRSLSTPKQRLRNIDSCSEYCVPFADRILSPLPSTVSDAGLSKISKSQKSPRVKIRTGPVKCNLTSDYHSFDSECSSFKRDQLNACL